ncbi:hypothetical protein ABZ208_13955 [Streptomyces sp. NPDC006208]|uniref:hypothetical protein n=1 Tax=Streptomyces sp. NPDC006208 TaxID=3156734 RepID=UPI0033BC7898
MNPVALAFGATWALILGTAAWYIARAIRRRYLACAQPRRDLATCRAIWPDADRAARVIETQHRLDTAKQRKEGTEQ